jgi:hypothetical protein
MTTYTRDQFEKQLAKGDLYPDDTYIDGRFKYRVEDILKTIAAMGYDAQSYAKLPPHKKAKVARESRRMLRREQKVTKGTTVKSKIHKAVMDRPLREDDLIVESGYAVRAIDMHDAIGAMMNKGDFNDKADFTYSDLIDESIKLLWTMNKIMPKPAGIPDSSRAAVIYCGTGPVIQNCLYNPEKLGVARETGRYNPKTHTTIITDDVTSETSAPPVRRHRETCIKVQRWIERGNFKLEKPQGSSLHHLSEYSRQHGEGLLYKALAPGGWMHDIQDFVIDHNWASAFRGATEFDEGEFQFPYGKCAFEFRVDNMRVIFMYHDRNDLDHVDVANLVIGCDDIWVLAPYMLNIKDQVLIQTEHPDAEDIKLQPAKMMPLYKLIFDQVRACCIMLDAKVAVKETIRAPERLNVKRERLGRTKLRDYHIVVLRRTRAAPHDFDVTHGERASPRLHFRRGHWRHFASHRTWINWQLIGNPDLGFVDKHYKL